MRRSWTAVAVLALAGVAALAEDPVREVPERTREAIFTGHALPRELMFGVMLSRSTLVHAVYGATALSGATGGRITRTGTLTPAGNGEYRYSPQPADRLVVTVGTETHEFVVKDVKGNLQEPHPAGFLMTGHELEYTHVIPGKMTADVKVKFGAGRVSMDLAGSYEQKGRTFEVDLRSRGTLTSSADLVGETTTTTFDVEGTVRCAALVMLLDVKERHEIVEMLSKERIPSRFQPVGIGKRMAKTLTTSSDVTNSTLRLGKDTYRWIDCSMRKTLWANELTHWPGDFNDWLCSGVVRRNDALYGRYDVVREGGSPDATVCRFVLKTIEGQMDVEVVRR